jgi:hypothetical protein
MAGQEINLNDSPLFEPERRTESSWEPLTSEDNLIICQTIELFDDGIEAKSRSLGALPRLQWGRGK